MNRFVLNLIRVEHAFINIVQVEGSMDNNSHQPGVVLGARKNATQSCELGPCLPC